MPPSLDLSAHVAPVLPAPIPFPPPLSDYLTPLLEAFISRAPFFLISTADAEGNCDVSPKGDPPGAVKILDARTIVIPDRAGNRRVDGHRNLLANPHVGLIFIIPNMDSGVCEPPVAQKTRYC
jgi:hypothetical protein